VVQEAVDALYISCARSDRYIILNRVPRPALAAQRVAWVRDPLDAERMHEAAQLLLGEHDFSSFRAAECQARTPMRYMHEITVERHGELVVLSVLANAFLPHMVRHIAWVMAVICRVARAARR